VGINTLRQGSRQLDVAAAPPLAIDPNGRGRQAGGRHPLPTVASLDDPSLNAAEFRKLPRLPAAALPAGAREAASASSSAA
jgi:hypothetical protein